MLIKKYGARFNKGLKIINLRDILLLSFYLVAVSVCGFELVDREFSSLLAETGNLFSFYSHLSKIDYEFRGGLQVYIERFFVFGVGLYTEAWPEKVSPQLLSQRLVESRRAMQAFQVRLKSRDIFAYFITEIEQTEKALLSAVTAYRTSRSLARLQSKTLQEIIRRRFKIVRYDPASLQPVSEQQMSNTLYMNIFISLLDDFKTGLQLVRPFCLDRAPPFGLQVQFLKEKFARPSESRFEVIRNSFNGLLDNQNKTLFSIRQVLVSEVPAAAKARLFFGQASFTAAFAIFVAAACWLSWRSGHRLYDLLTCYRHLRPEEIAATRSAMSDRLACFSRYRLNEAAMIAHYTDRADHRIDAAAAGSIGKRLAKDSGHAQKQPFMPRDGLRYDIRFRSSIIFQALTGASLGLLVYFFAGVQANLAEASAVEKKIAFCITVQEKITAAYNLYIIHTLYLLYGNFIKVNGLVPSEAIRLIRLAPLTPTRDLFQFLVNQRNNLVELFGVTNGMTIDSFIFEDACLHLSPDKPNFATRKPICQEDLFASQGLLSYLDRQLSVHSKIRDTVAADKKFLEQSEREWVLSPFQAYIFSEEQTNYRIVSKTLYETFSELVIPAGVASISQQLDRLDARAMLLSRVSPPLLVLAFAAFFVVFAVRSTYQDLLICAETLSNLPPTVCLSNKAIAKKFDETFCTLY